MLAIKQEMIFINNKILFDMVTRYDTLFCLMIRRYPDTVEYYVFLGDIMKRLFLSLLIMGAATPLLAEKGWTPVSAEEKEYNKLLMTCLQMAAQSPGGCGNNIFFYLKDIGTPTSLRVLKELISRGIVHASFLSAI